jgi:hypothetical protein
MPSGFVAAATVCCVIWISALHGVGSVEEVIVRGITPVDGLAEQQRPTS